MSPGSLLQLLLGLLFAFFFSILQVWWSPYRTPSNNLFALGVNVALVLNFISSIGIQVNAEYNGDVDSTLLSIVLYAATFALVPLIAVSLLVTLRQGITPEQLRAYLLDGDDDGGSSPLPLVARFGQFAINAADVGRALNAPLLGDAERRAICETVLASGDDTRFVADPAALVFGQPREAALGVEHFMCVRPNMVRAAMSEGAAAIRREIEAAAASGDQRAVDTLECLDYVQLARAGSSDKRFPNSPHPRDCDESGLRVDRRTATGEGMQLADFLSHPHSREAQLEEAHVLALRLYTTWAFLLLNGPLRDVDRHARGEPHPLPVTVAFLAEGIRRLRAVGARRSDASKTLFFYRGLANRTVPPAFAREGGTELAPMSTTTDLSVAVRYSTSRSSVLLRVNTKSFMERGEHSDVMCLVLLGGSRVAESRAGADISYLSAFPGEAEVLFPVR